MIITELPNGNLEMQARTDDAGNERRELVELLLRGTDGFCDVSVEADFIARYLVPEGFEEMKPEDCGALTSATLIARDGQVWADMNYQVEAFIVELAIGRKVIWTKG